MEKIISQVRKEGDSVGGTIETAIINVPVGLGEPFFHSVESRLSQMMFSIPSVKAIEFGIGFDMGNAKGSQVKDEYIIKDGKIKTLENHNGGIVGGLSNDANNIYYCIKAYPSIDLLKNSKYREYGGS